MDNPRWEELERAACNGAKYPEVAGLATEVMRKKLEQMSKELDTSA